MKKLATKPEFFGCILLIISIVIFASTALSQQASSELERAYEKYQAEEYEQVIALIEPKIRHGYPPEGAYRLISSSYLLTGQSEKAYRAAAEGSGHYPRSAELQVMMVDALRHDDPDRALEKLDDIITAFEEGELHSEGIGPDDFRQYKSRIHIMGGRAALDMSDFESAAAHFESAVTLDPDDISNYHHLLYSYLRAGEYDKVLEEYDALPSELQSDRTMVTLRSQALLELEEVGELSEIYRELYEENPDDLEQALVYGQLLMADNQILKANELFNNLLEKYPEERRIYDVLIEVNQQQMNYQGLAVLYEEMIQNFPDDDELPLKLAEVRQIRGEYDKAVAVYDSLIQNRGREYRFFRKQAAIHYRQGDAEKAYRKLGEAAGTIVVEEDTGDWAEDPDAETAGDPEEVTFRSDGIEWLFDMGKLSFDMGEYPDAAEYFTSYTRQAPQDSLGWKMLGRAYEYLNDPESAYEAYQAAISGGAFWPEAYTMLAGREYPLNEDTLYYALEHAVGEIEERKQLLGLQAQFAMRGKMQGDGGHLFYPAEDQLRDIMNSLDVLNDFIIESLPAARIRNMYDRLMQEYPDNSGAYELAASYFDSAGDEEQALLLYRSAADINPEDHRYHMSIASIKEEQGKYDQAVIWYERALGAGAASGVYRSLIRVHRENGTLDQLADRWLIRYQSTSVDPEFREYLIDALHRAGRRAEAREIAQDG